MSTDQRDNVQAFRISLLASVLLMANLISMMLYVYFYSYHTELAAVDQVIVAINLVASVGLLASIVLSMNDHSRLAAYLFDVGVLVLLVYLVLIAVRMISYQESNHYY
jgi:hypothetical protein